MVRVFAFASFFAFGFAALVAAAPAAAQSARQGFALERIHSPASVEDGLARDLPSTLGHLRLSTYALVLHSIAPLVYRDAASGTDLGEVVATRTGAVLAVALGLGRWAEIAIQLPAIVAQSGDTLVVPTGDDLAVPTSFALGDPRVGGSYHLIGRPLRGPQLAISAFASIPLGDEEALAGDGALGGQARLSAAYAGRGLTASVGLGAALRPERTFETATSGPEWLADAGLYVRPHRRLVLSAEFLAATAIGSGAFSGERSPLETILGLRFSPGRGAWLGVGGGAGLGSAPGSPDLRLLASVGYAPPRALRVRRSIRARPRPPEPAPDEDALEPEPGLEPEPEDAPAPVETPPAAPPRDADGDGIPIDSDRCPDVAENRNENEDEDGCPDDPRVEGGRIVRTGAVEFYEGTDRIRGASVTTLETVRSVLTQNPWIRLVRIEGHTDDQGSVAGNREVSAQRARVVMRWLVEHGVEPDRLVAQGLGPDRPIADNATRQGRRANRRVEFHVVETGQATAEPESTPSPPPPVERAAPAAEPAPELESDPGF